MINDNFPVIPSSILPHPGKCYKCGSNLRDCIDLGFDAEYYGAVLLCLLCAHSLVDVVELDFVPRNELKDAEFQVAKLQRRETKFTEARAAFNSGVLAAIDTFDSVADSDDPLPVLIAETPKADFGDFYGAFSKG